VTGRDRKGGEGGGGRYDVALGRVVSISQQDLDSSLVVVLGGSHEGSVAQLLHAETLRERERESGGGRRGSRCDLASFDLFQRQGHFIEPGCPLEAAEEVVRGRGA
jgi:hypothetical protein